MGLEEYFNPLLLAPTPLSEVVATESIVCHKDYYNTRRKLGSMGGDWLFRRIMHIIYIMNRRRKKKLVSYRISVKSNKSKKNEKVQK